MSCLLLNPSVISWRRRRGGSSTSTTVQRDVIRTFSTNNGVNEAFFVALDLTNFAAAMGHIGSFDAVQQLAEMLAGHVRVHMLLIFKVLTASLNDGSFVLIHTLDAEPVVHDSVDSWRRYIVFEDKELGVVLLSFSL